MALVCILTSFFHPWAVADEWQTGPCENVPLSRDRAMTYAPGVGAVGDEPLALSVGPHLFVDDYLIASSENVTRVVNMPRRNPSIPNPVITGREDGCFQPYMSVLQDDATGRFRMWYGRHTDDFNGSRSQLGYAESTDGIRWERPTRVLGTPSPIQFGVSVVDGGADCPNPATRYTFGWYLDTGLKIATSPDGLAWTTLTPDPALRHNHDISGLHYDPVRKRYVATASVYRTGNDWNGKRRITMHSHSKDLLRWSSAYYVVLPDDSCDEGETQFYAMDGYLTRGDLLFGMVKVLRDDVKVDDPPDPPEAYGMGYTELAWTRDGETWVRDPAPFFAPNPEKGTWDHAHAWIDEQVLVDDDVYLYYGGYARGHKVNRFEERQIGLVKVRKDRYVARAASETAGTIVTPLVLLEGSRLTVNADAEGGEVRVQLKDAAGHVIHGCSFGECAAVTGDVLDAPVNWKESLSKARTEPVRLEFSLKNARLYGFYLRQ